MSKKLFKSIWIIYDKLIWQKIILSIIQKKNINLVL